MTDSGGTGWFGKVEVPITIFSMWCVYHMGWYFACQLFFRRIPQFKKRLQDLNIPYESEVEWYMRCVSTEHAVGALILALLWHLEVLGKDFVLTHTAGYFVFDLFVVLTHINDFRKETATFIHHGAGVFASWAGLLISAPHWLIKYYLLTEASTIFVNLRWNFYVLTHNREGRTALAVGLLMAVSFFIVRTLPLPYVWTRGAIFVWWEEAQYPVWVRVLCAIIVTIFCGLNAMWSYRIIMALRKAFLPKPTEPALEANP